jgi:hypothetical protein
MNKKKKDQVNCNNEIEEDAKEEENLSVYNSESGDAAENDI